MHRYVGVDINGAFLEWLRPRLAGIAAGRASFAFTLVCGDIKTVEVPMCDAVIFMSSLHHIPDRLDVFRRLAIILRPDGAILAVEPAHYLLRLRTLLRKYVHVYHRPAHWKERHRLGTHHFCTLGEFRWIVQRLPELTLESVAFFDFWLPRGTHRMLRPWLARRAEGSPAAPVVRDSGSPLRYLSGHIAAVMRRAGG